ncbi:MAG: glycosyltransferase family 4 protein, partial [Acidimicrobiales bacterium]
GWGILALQREGWPVLETSHHPITVDRRLELEHARSLTERVGKRRWYAFTRMQTRVARRMPRVMTVSESSRSDIHRDHRVPLDRLHVVPVGVDPDLFRPVPGVERVPGRLVTLGREPEAGTGTFVQVYVNDVRMRLSGASADVAMKGLRFLLEALAKLRTERHVELTIIGRPNPDSAASRTMTELGLDGLVTFVSGVPDQRIVELYSEAELAVVPSLYEGFSLPAIEAMASGVPLVATTGGALPEVAGSHGETCFLSEPGDSESLAAVIRAALDDANARARVGAAGRRRVIDHWSWRHTAERTVAQYRALLAEHAGRRGERPGGGG